MQKRGFFRLLAVSAALVLVISACCITVLGYEPNHTEAMMYEGTVTKDENNPPVAPSPDTSGNSSSDNSSESSSNESSGGSSNDSSVESSDDSSMESSDDSSKDNDTDTETETSDTGTTTSSNSSSAGSNHSSNDNTSNNDPAWEPEDPGTTTTTSDPVSGPNFSDDDNSDLIDDGSVISSLPIEGELDSQNSESGSEASSQAESSEAPKASGNSGSSFLLVLGISLIVLGVAGLGTVVYLQFIRPKMAAGKKAAIDGETELSSFSDGFSRASRVDAKADTAEIDINSYDAGAEDNLNQNDLDQKDDQD